MLQRTSQWYRARLGKVTGSRVGDLMGQGRGAEFSKTGIAYLNEIAAERLLSPMVVNDDELFEAYLDEISTTSKAMRIGTEREVEAREVLAAVLKRPIHECECINHPHITGFASSPDGCIHFDNHTEVVEIKCPKPSTAMQYIADMRCADDLKRINSDYYWQCQAHMSVTGAARCHFAVYCPWLTKPLRRIVIERDQQEVAILEQRIEQALQYVDNVVAGTSEQVQPKSNGRATMVACQVVDEPVAMAVNPDNAREIRISKVDATLIAQELPVLLKLIDRANLDAKQYNKIRRLQLIAGKLNRKLSKQT